jgi:hypothetical protein
MGQKQAAKTQAEMQRRATEAELDRVATMQSSMRLKERQEKLQAAQKLMENQRRLREAQATATVAAGESGITGQSVDLVSADMTRRAAEYGNSIRQNLELADISRQYQFGNVANQAVANLININQPIEPPDYVGNILSGVSTGFSTYSGMKDAGLIKPKAP